LFQHPYAAYFVIFTRSKPLFEIGPGCFVVLFAVAAVEGGVVGDGSFDWAAGLGVIGDGSGDGAGLEGFDVFPAWVITAKTQRTQSFFVFFFLCVLCAFAVCSFPGEADAGEALGAGEDDAAFLIVPGIGLVLAHDRELDAVDGFQFFQGKPQGHGGEDIDFHQGLAAGIVGAQGTVAVPGGGEVLEKGVGQAGVVLGPAVVSEIILPAFLPEFGVVGCEAGESESPHLKSRSGRLEGACLLLNYRE